MNVDHQAYLEHYGVKGMKWGVRKDRTGDSSGISRKTRREASKDAEEFSRAKMYYGEGAGTRRKLIKATVESKKAKDPSYAKAFDEALNSQDMSKHAQKARTERKRTDRKETTRRTTKAVLRRVMQEQGTSMAMVALVAAGISYVQTDSGKAMMKKGVNTFNKGVDKAKQKKGAYYTKKLLNDLGV